MLTSLARPQSDRRRALSTSSTPASHRRGARRTASEVRAWRSARRASTSSRATASGAALRPTSRSSSGRRRRTSRSARTGWCAVPLALFVRFSHDFTQAAVLQCRPVRGCIQRHPARRPRGAPHAHPAGRCGHLDTPSLSSSDIVFAPDKALQNLFVNNLGPGDAVGAAKRVRKMESSMTFLNNDNGGVKMPTSSP